MGEIAPGDHELDASVRITASRDLDVYVSRPASVPGIKVVAPEEPVVNLDPGTLQFAETLSLNVLADDLTAFGIRLTFPKVAFVDHEEMKVPHLDRELDNHVLFEMLTGALRAVTRPCRIESPIRIHKPAARISDAAKAALRGRPYFAKHGLALL